MTCFGSISAEQITKAPHAALIGRRSTRVCDCFQVYFSCGRVGIRAFPRWISDFEQVATFRAAEVLAGVIAQIAAGNATESEVLLAHARRGTGDR